MRFFTAQKHKYLNLKQEHFIRLLLQTIFPLLILFLITINGFSQTTFQYTIGGSGDDRAYDLISLSDGYALTGFSSSQGSGSEDAYLIKLNDSFNLEWSKVIGSQNNDRAHKVIPSNDGGFLITGQTYTNGNNNPSDMLMAKTDDSGDLTWISSNGESQHEVGWGLVELPDNNLIFTGSSSSYAITGNGAYLFKTNPTGNPIWGTIFDNTSAMAPPATDYFRDIILCSTGDYVYMTGTAKRPGTCQLDNNRSNWHMLIAKADLDGQLIWHTYVGGNTCREIGFGLTQTSDGHIVATGFTQNFGAGGDDVYLAKVDGDNGQMIWTRTYGGPGHERANKVAETADGGLVLTGWTDSYGAGSTDVLLLKTDEQGFLEWSRTYGGPGSEEGYSGLQTDDLGYLIAGYTTSYGNGGEDIFIIKTDEEGRIDHCEYGSPALAEGIGGSTHTGLRTSTGFDVAGVSARNDPGNDLINELECCPSADFEIGEICPETPIQFTDLSEGNIVSWHWNFGDGNESNDNNPIHLYTEPGNYTVTLIVSNEVDCADTATMEIDIPEKIELYIEGDSVICAGQSATLTAHPGGHSYMWNTGESSQMITVDPEENTEFSVWQTDIGNCIPDTAFFIVEVTDSISPWVTGDTLLCSGQTTQLTAHPENAEYQWSTGEFTQSIQFSPENDTSLFVIVSDNTQCIFDTVFIQLEVIDELSAGITGDTLLCSGQNTQLTAHPPNAEYQWSTGESTQSIELNPQNDTSLYVIVSDNTQCNSDTVFISLEVIEHVSSWVTGDTLLCSGQNTQLTAHPDNSEYLWSTGESTQSIELSPPNDTSLFVIVSDNTQCNSDTVFISLEVIEPVSSWVTGDTLLCRGQTTQLTAHPPNAEYQWSTGEFTQSIQFSPEDDTSLYVIVGDSTRCIFDTLFINLEVTEQLSGWITGDTILCRGQTTQLTAHPDNAEYQWSTGQSSSSILLSPENDTLLYVIVSDSTQCISDTVFISLEVIEHASPWVTGDTLLCSGQTTQLTAHPNNAEYQWSTGESTQSIQFSPGNDTSLYVFVNDTTQCIFDTLFINVEVIEELSAGITGDTLLCSGQNTQLTAQPDNAEYLWSNGEITQSVLLSPQNDTLLHVVVSDSFQCNYDTAFIFVEVIEPINPGFSGETLLCNGQTTQITAQPADANFQWSTGETTQSILLSPPNDTSLFVIVSDGTPCNYDTVFISVEVIDPITPRVTGDTLLCRGHGTRLTAHPENAEYLWSTGEITRSVELSPETDTSLFVIVSDSMQCSIDTLNVNLHILLEDFAEIRGSMLLCQGEETQLTAHPPDLNYKWSTGDTAQSIILSPNVDTRIWLKIIQGECFDSTEVNINVWEYADLKITPGDTIICPGEELFLTVMSSNCTEFHWTPDSGLDCNTCANPLVFPEAQTTYFVSCENDSLCFSMDSVTVFIETNVEEVCHHCETTNVYIPNSFSPNDDGINDVFYIVGPGIESILSFQVFSRWGEKVFGIAHTPANEPAFGWDGSFKNLKAEPGVYLYRAEILCEKMGTTVKEGAIKLFR